MIQAIELENFKGIAGRQRIDFAPLTLLFGANSAGKSTILQALLYLHEVLERGSADVDRTELGGEALELGGFGRVVNGHTLDQTISLRAEFDTPGSLNRFGRDISSFPLPDLDDEFKAAWIELELASASLPGFAGPLVRSVKIGAAGEATPLLWLELGVSLREGDPLYARVNMQHPLIAGVAEHLLEDWRSLSAVDPLILQMRELDRAAREANLERGPMPEADLVSPALTVFAVSRTGPGALPSLREPFRVLYASDAPGQTAPALERVSEQVRTFLEMVVHGTVGQLLATLRGAAYLGPLRTVPPRGFLYERAGRVSSWAGGLAAWDLLLADRGQLAEATNAWMDRLGARTQVVVQQLVDPQTQGESGEDDAVRRILLVSGSGALLLPSEVGAGISQLLPVVVAAIGTRKPCLVMVEQPEIHVHPALQTGVGDLLIEAAQGRQLIVETHSEHVVLRLLRRIRETSAKELPDGAPAFTPEKLSVLWVESGGGGEGTTVRRLRVDETGEFVDRWPKGFFEERAKELF